MSPRQVWALKSQLPRDRLIEKMDAAMAYQLAHAGEGVWKEHLKGI